MEGDGRINWVLDVSGVRLLGLDTVIPGQGGGEIDAETLDFLDGALQDAASRPVLLATHHPPFSCGIRFMDSIGLEGVEALARRLAVREGDLCSISGHVHGIHVSTVGGGPAITCPSLTSTFSVDFRDDAPVDFTTQAGAMFCMTGRAASAAASCPLHLELAHTRLRPETSSLAPPSTCAPIRP